MLLSTHMTITKSALWIQDEAIKTGVFFSLTRTNHHANSLFVDSQSLSPGTTNLVSMKPVKKDRRAYSEDNADFLLKKSDYCCSKVDEYERNHSSLPMTQYNQAHCRRMTALKMFQEMKKCRIAPLFGTLDLEDNATLPICRRAQMHTLMPTFRSMGDADDDTDHCPKACIEEDIERSLSFTIMSDETFEAAWNTWPMLPPNRTKYEALFMELYFSSLTSQVRSSSSFSCYPIFIYR